MNAKGIDSDPTCNMHCMHCLYVLYELLLFDVLFKTLKVPSIAVLLLVLPMGLPLSPPARRAQASRPPKPTTSSATTATTATSSRGRQPRPLPGAGSLSVPCRRSAIRWGVGCCRSARMSCRHPRRTVAVAASTPRHVSASRGVRQRMKAEQTTDLTARRA